jgi:hypothetical protein
MLKDPIFAPRASAEYSTFSPNEKGISLPGAGGMQVPPGSGEWDAGSARPGLPVRREDSARPQVNARRRERSPHFIGT